MELATTKGRPHVAARRRTMCAPTNGADRVGRGLLDAPWAAEDGGPYSPPGGGETAPSPVPPTGAPPQEKKRTRPFR